MNKYKPITLISLISLILFIPLVLGSYVSTFSLNNEQKIIYWEQWNDSDSQNVYLVSEEEIGILLEGFTPGSIYYCWTPLFYNDTTGKISKMYWISNVKPVKCIWEYYDPQMHRIYRVEKKPAILYEGNFEGFRYAFADHNEFVIPALFLSQRYGDWAVRTYFKFEDGTYGGEGPVVDEYGNSYMLSFTVVKGSWIDLFFKAPIYILGYKTIPLFWWLSPLWIIVILFIILVVYTRSVVGAVRAIKRAIEATKEAKKEWRK